MIPGVAFLDLVFANVAYWLTLLVHGWLRRVLWTLVVYCLVEAAFHVPLEWLAGRLL